MEINKKTKTMNSQKTHMFKLFTTYCVPRMTINVIKTYTIYS